MTDDLDNLIESILKPDKSLVSSVHVYNGTTEKPGEIVGKCFEQDDCYVVIQKYSGIELKKGTNIDFETANRLKAFNRNGDLMIWRTQSCYRWRYIGLGKPIDKASLSIASEGYHARSVSFNLWGITKRNGKRHEPRLASANLEYPDFDSNSRVKLNCIEYSKNGTVQFVQYVELVSDPEGGITIE